MSANAEWDDENGCLRVKAEVMEVEMGVGVVDEEWDEVRLLADSK